ncbi:sensor histidine kinase [Nocardioides mangrovi]|uniref:histidine kinase n=1 Tax=Nocardioides mangrovi TaxID=2874580 RepID=A0ABS7UCG4_9ACTN|nr:GAF domain-containing sensor histidine kinase [Nocardioides mangrovi]MBZ5738358.1 GAF domain-containing sensor histidine kinase [Nocardioides mangrovi]
MSEEFERPVRGSRRSDDQARSSLLTIIEALGEATGFDVVGISGVRDDGYLHVLCVVGPDDAREALMDTLAPVDPLIEQLEVADDWGALKFVPHERMVLDVDKWGWISDRPQGVDPGAWHPENLLVAPVYGEQQQLLGVLGMELPRDGLVPVGERRTQVDMHVRQACRAVSAILERERMAEQVRLASAAADIVRRASGKMSVDEVLADCGSAIVEGFRGQSLWFHLFGEDPRAVVDDNPVEPPPEMIDVIVRYGEAGWQRQTVGVFAPDRRPPEPLSQADVDTVLGFLAGTGGGAESLLVAPLGAGEESLGVLAVTRAFGGAEWSEGETAAAIDIGRDLGRVLANARTFEREHRLVEELQELADYKTRLVATVSHELRTPLTSVVGFAELLRAAPELSDRSRTAVDAIQRGAVRLTRVVEDLLVLHRATDADIGEVLPLDLAPIVADAVELSAGPAAQRGITLTADLPEGGATVLGVAHELEHLPTNLIGNAVKYTPDHGTVTVSLEVLAGEVVLTCTDSGIGISAADQERVFEEFFRSADPEAAARYGTGLGLAIVRRVVERHGGRIELESDLGRGSTFRVSLPAG